MIKNVLRACALVALFSAAAQAAPERAVCAVEQAISCGPYESCERNLPGAVNLPSLLKIDRVAGTIQSRGENGSERVSMISGDSGDDATHFLSGIDSGNAWTIRINLESGRFTLASAHGDAGFIAFGLCSSKLLD